MQKSIKVTEPAILELSKMQASDWYAWWPDKAGDSRHLLTLCPTVLALHLCWVLDFPTSFLCPVASMYCFTSTHTLTKFVFFKKKLTEEKVIRKTFKVQTTSKEFNFHIQSQNNSEVTAFIGHIQMLCSRPNFKTYNGWFSCILLSLPLIFFFFLWIVKNL